VGVKQVLLKQGQALIEDIPAPMDEEGYSLIYVSHSCISTGTELSGLKENGIPLWKKALKHPEKVKKAFAMLATKGFSKTKSILQGQLSSGVPSGYSAAGTVLGTTQRVACAGAQCAHHAEIIQVPDNLMVPIPENVGFAEASTVALGAIALQGIRRAQPTLGETFAVIGLGFLGQVTGQLLQANGCRVFGIDLDLKRVELAETFGLLSSFPSHLEVDGVIITAGTASSEVISQAFQLCRKKGRVVLVGDVGLHLKRTDFYKKELDFLISCSYGPGRYDDRYEEQGFDYPMGYVRWTETRNMEEYLHLLAQKKVDVSPFVQSIFPVDQAADAYAFLKDKEKKPLLALLSYPPPISVNRVVSNPRASPCSKEQLQVGLIGAGGFAKEMHLPNLQSLKEYRLKAVVSRSGDNAKATMRQFEASYATTNPQEMLQDAEIDLVIIATRHHLHMNQVLEALQAGKHVLVEKPLCLNKQELEKILDFYAKNPDGPILLTGFNRRFSTYAKKIHQVAQKRVNPMVINYRMNAGFLPLQHWVHGEEGGGRNIGEACHIYDLFTFLTGSKVQTIDAHSIQSATHDNFIATMSFQDGSIATLTYTSLGPKDYPKEQMEIFMDGQVLVMNDYQSLNVPKFASKQAEKGQKEELVALAKAIREGGPWPIPLWQQAQAMDIAFRVEEWL